ncbi:MAG TPA: putative capsular polysaccharide synthesis family protein [Pseudomonadales bacterium]
MSRHSFGDLIQVLTMGRVASSTVQRSIEGCLGRRVRHLHSINPTRLSAQVAKSGSLAGTGRSVRDAHAAVIELIRHQGRVKTVTLVRDAIARNLSAAFAVVRKRYRQPEAIEAFLSEPDDVRSMWARFYDKRPFRWFDLEIREVLGIDVYDHPFPEEGVLTIEHGRHELLVMRTELDDTRKSAALADFLGVDDVPLSRANERSRQDEYVELYEKFRRSVALEEEYVRSVAESKYTSHFYGHWAPDDYVDYWMSETRPSGA